MTFHHLSSLKMLGAPLVGYAVRRPFDRGRANRCLVRDIRAMGPTYVKIAQFIASRGDVFDPDLTTELQVLQDQNVLDGFDSMDIIRAEVSDVLVDAEPFAGASLSVVHRGKYEGREVAVKVKRPNLEAELRRDIQNLRELLLLLSFRSNVRDTLGILNEAERYLMEEIDFAREAENSIRYKETAPAYVRIPEVYAVSENVMIQEYIEGTRVDSPPNGIDSRKLARYLLYSQFDSVMRGFFHGDTHGGNILVDPSGRLVLLDFGLCVDIGGNEVKESLTCLLKALVDRNVDAFYENLVSQNVIVLNSGCTPSDVKRYLKIFFVFLERPIEKIDVEELRVLENSRSFRFTYPWILAFKTIASLEGIAIKVADVRIRDVVEEYGKTRLTDMTGVPRQNILGTVQKLVTVPGTLVGLDNDLSDLSSSLKSSEKQTQNLLKALFVLDIILHFL